MASDISADGVVQLTVQNSSPTIAHSTAAASHAAQAPQGAGAAPDSTHSCTLSHASNKTCDPCRQRSQEPGVASPQEDKQCSPSEGAASIAESDTRPSALPLPCNSNFVRSQCWTVCTRFPIRKLHAYCQCDLSSFQGDFAL